ncbi:MAG: FAD-dependent monooxygenase [Burkholderiales bacterium]|nr:FAD-dependent monooxygenase [Burkholderiales bacterium]
MDRPDCDVVIAGAGPAGGALALALRASGLRLAVLETQFSPMAADPRPLALAYGTRLLLERLDLWRSLAPVTPILGIHVSQRGGFGRVMLDAAAARLPALGYVLDYARLAALTRERLEGDWCEYLPGASICRVDATADAVVLAVQGAGGGMRRIRARLLAVADGGTGAAGEAMRAIDYGQAAVTARVASVLPHEGVAYERFTPEGPLALLPDGERSALVWVTAPERARALSSGPEPEFLAGLQQAFGGRLGRFTAVERRGVFPLALKLARDPVERRTVRIGNAAQTLHPVAGQGLNLALRDAWELAEVLGRAPREALGEPGMLRRYATRRRLDRAGAIGFTHGLARIFSSDLAPLRCARGFALAALAASPPARDFLVRRMSFGARG